MKYLKKEKGITIISLVVTIIILIILAGISINLTIGEDGLITKAKQAKENTELAQIEEQEKLNELYAHLSSNGEISGDISYDSIAKLIEFKKSIADYIGEAGGIKPEYTADTLTFGESIKGIVAEVTKNATATSDDIAEGKTAWVSGNLITGTNKNDSSLDISDIELNQIKKYGEHISLATALTHTVQSDKAILIVVADSGGDATVVKTNDGTGEITNYVGGWNGSYSVLGKYQKEVVKGEQISVYGNRTTAFVLIVGMDSPNDKFTIEYEQMKKYGEHTIPSNAINYTVQSDKALVIVAADGSGDSSGLSVTGGIDEGYVVYVGSSNGSHSILTKYQRQVSKGQTVSLYGNRTNSYLLILGK